MKAFKVLAYIAALCLACVSCDPDNIINNNPNLNEKEETSKYTAVDLGLSVKWATFNVGATSPEEFGDYFCWGETTPNSNYFWDTYKWCEYNSNTKNVYFTKYFMSTENTNNTYSFSGNIDRKIVLERTDDAATVNWGGNWRMPTIAEMYELSQCKKQWTFMFDKSGVAVHGMQITGPNGNSIFLPAAGRQIESHSYKMGNECCYWSSSLVELDSPYAHLLYANVDAPGWSGGYRCSGFPVRPVCP